jgi:hypothetical protein
MRCVSSKRKENKYMLKTNRTNNQAPPKQEVVYIHEDSEFKNQISDEEIDKWLENANKFYDWDDVKNKLNSEVTDGHSKYTKINTRLAQIYYDITMHGTGEVEKAIVEAIEVFLSKSSDFYNNLGAEQRVKWEKDNVLEGLKIIGLFEQQLQRNNINVFNFANGVQKQQINNQSENKRKIDAVDPNALNNHDGRDSKKAKRIPT